MKREPNWGQKSAWEGIRRNFLLYSTSKTPRYNNRYKTRRGSFQKSHWGVEKEGVMGEKKRLKGGGAVGGTAETS